MAQGPSDRRPVARLLLRGFFLRAFQWLLHPQGKPLAMARAWPSFAPDPEPPAFPRDPPNSATPPRFAMFPAQIFQSIARGWHRADTPLPPATELQEWVCLFPICSRILFAKS